MHATKITSPKVSGVLNRGRLFRSLDTGLRKPLIWVSAAAGFGKTTLVSSFLKERRIAGIWYRMDERDNETATFFQYFKKAAETSSPDIQFDLQPFTPEYYNSLSVFTRNFFESLFSKLTPPFVLVFDNYQEVDTSALLHQVLKDGLSVIPEGVHFIIISRRESEAAFSRLKVHDQMAVITGNDLAFNLEETVEMAEMQTELAIPSQLLTRIHQKTTGWVAGLILALKTVMENPDGYDKIDDIQADQFFDYFAMEIFENSDPDIRTFLLKTAFLPELNGELCETLTHLKNSTEILSELNRANYFTDKYSDEKNSYYYHPLFQEFLLSYAKSHLPKSELISMELRAAEILEQKGRFEDATPLYINAECWDKATSLILLCFKSLVEHGRYKTIEKWLNQLPKGIREGSDWMVFCGAVACFWRDLEKGRQLFERAFKRFNRSDDMNGALLAWSGIVDSIFFEQADATRLDPLIEWMDNFISRDKGFPSQEAEHRAVRSMTKVLTIRAPFHPQADFWISKARGIANMESANDNAIIQGIELILYYISIGDFEQTSILYKSILPRIKSENIKPITRLWGKMMDLINMWLTASPGKDVLTEVKQALVLSNELGIHFLDNIYLRVGIQSALALQDYAAFDWMIEKLEGYLKDQTNWNAGIYHGFLAVRFMNKKAFKEAREHGLISLGISTRLGLPLHAFWPRLLIVHLAIEQKNLDEAREHLDELKKVGANIPDFKFKGLVLLSESYLAIAERKEDKGLKLLDQSFAELEGTNNANIAFWVPFVLLKGCVKALEEQIQTDFVLKLIQKANLLPEAVSGSMENWPYPVKIYTLGNFKLFLDGELIQYGKKVPKKPLALLKVIITFGGSDVSEEQISEALWPDADGDMAHSNFTTTLQRLRKMIGYDKAIRVSQGRVSLDPRYCWIDTWSIRYLLDQIAHELDNQNQRAQEQTSLHKLHQLCKKIGENYGGPFLQGDAGTHWTTYMQERLTRRIFKAYLTVGKLLEQEGQWNYAVGIYNSGLAIDPLVEEFYQRLLICYMELGLNAEAIATFESCRQSFQHHLQIEPSPKTYELYEKALD